MRKECHSNPEPLQTKKAGTTQRECPSSDQMRNRRGFYHGDFHFLVDSKGFEPSTSRMRTSTRNFFRVFPAVFSCFRSAPLHLWASLTMLFPCGPEQCVVGSVVRNAPSPCRRLSPTGTGSVFHASNCLHCTSVDRIKQVISVLSTAQKLRDCKQKEAFCSKRLRNLKRMFMRILHLL